MWQQKCLAYIHRSIGHVLETQTDRTRIVGEGLKALLQEAIQLWHAYPAVHVPDFTTAAKTLQEELTYQLYARRLHNADNQRLLNELSCHHHCGNLLRCMKYPDSLYFNHFGWIMIIRHRSDLHSNRLYQKDLSNRLLAQALFKSSDFLICTQRNSEGLGCMNDIFVD
jgi:hypothetical protein